MPTPARLLLICALLVAGSASSSSAATPRHCPLIVDPRGDADEPTFGVNDVYVPHLLPATRADDILSADVASDREAMTVVVRVDDLTPADLTASPGHHVTLGFTVSLGQGDAGEDVRLALSATTAADGQVFAASTASLGPNVSSSVGVTGSFDPAANSVRLRALYSTLSQLAGQPVGRGSFAYDIAAGTARAVATAAGARYHDPDDSARTALTHTFGTRRCRT